VSRVQGDLLFFLDDDACLPEDDILTRMARQFAADPTLGMIQPRVVDPDGREAPRRWIPRIRVNEPAVSSPAMNVWEGAVAIRRDAFEFAGGWPEPFWYAHEGIDLTWRVWDSGFHVLYDGEIEVHHPAIQPTRHSEFYRYQARNRVWLARRNLPMPVGVLYVSLWAGVTALRLRSRTALIETLRGYRMGLTEPGGERRPMRWRTIWRMTRAGRPPVI
jgi:GT2 family glycosyltransferase